mmetsp:Transcript_17609/g.45947  ORF Transcript_17609/g.45947 Transcript_17609/m.45947 type:complete len:230 (-) Transcript_17609:788-1477(-)
MPLYVQRRTGRAGVPIRHSLGRPLLPLPLCGRPLLPLSLCGRPFTPLRLSSPFAFALVGPIRLAAAPHNSLFLSLAPPLPLPIPLSIPLSIPVTGFAATSVRPHAGIEVSLLQPAVAGTTIRVRPLRPLIRVIIVAHLSTAAIFTRQRGRGASAGAFGIGVGIAPRPGVHVERQAPKSVESRRLRRRCELFTVPVTVAPLPLPHATRRAQTALPIAERPRLLRCVPVAP